MSDTTSVQEYLFLPILTVRTRRLPNKECISCNLLWICWSQLSSQRFRIHFTMKGLKSAYGIEQLDIGSINASLASWSTTVFPWVPIWPGIYVKMTCLPIETSFYKLQPFLNERALSFKTLSCQQARKRIWTDHEITLIRRCNELQSRKYCISFCTEDRTGRW